MFGQLSTTQKLMGAFFATLLVAVFGGVVFYFFPSASNQGYAPEQPIPFSHKLHSGDNQISCRYCHSGAWESQHANVPSLNVCMNCHTVVKTESPHIQRMISSYEAGKPIEWIRVHELPDHARFNHSRHVKKGVSCETCHGDVKKMDKVEQFAPLTMGWCLSCHRGQEVPSKVLSNVRPGENPEDIKGEPIAPFGCATCHY